MASMTRSGTPAALSWIKESALVSNFRCEVRIFWMMTVSGRPARTVFTTVSLVSTSWAVPRPPVTAPDTMKTRPVSAIKGKRWDRNSRGIEIVIRMVTPSALKARLTVLTTGEAGVYHAVLRAERVARRLAIGARRNLYNPMSAGGQLNGPNMLLVDGRTASTPTAQYPPIEVQINVASSGPSRVPFILYLPALDTAHPITLPLDSNGATTQQVQATVCRPGPSRSRGHTTQASEISTCSAYGNCSLQPPRAAPIAVHGGWRAPVVSGRVAVLSHRWADMSPALRKLHRPQAQPNRARNSARRALVASRKGQPRRADSLTHDRPLHRPPSLIPKRMSRPREAAPSGFSYFSQDAITCGAAVSERTRPARRG